MHECLNNNAGIKKFVREKFQSAMWYNNIGRINAYYIKEFNPTEDHGEKAYLGAAIKGQARLLLAQLRTRSHHLRCETSRWKRPKETWEERICMFCRTGTTEIK